MDGANDPALRVIDSTDDGSLPPAPPGAVPTQAAMPSGNSAPVTIPAWAAAFLLGLVNRCGLPLDTPGLIDSFRVLRHALMEALPPGQGERRV